MAKSMHLLGSVSIWCRFSFSSKSNADNSCRYAGQ